MFADLLVPFAWALVAISSAILAVLLLALMAFIALSALIGGLKCGRSRPRSA
ncbi:MAG: hypothetical protein QOH04_1537 [Sphingomonadales bacterium]|jgi:hypothetical protein|nr:hypothetical protein [Sphingomonadales bacterium]